MTRSFERRLLAATFCLLTSSAPAAAQAGDYLRIEAPDTTLLVPTGELQEMSRETMTVTFHDTETVRFEGVPLYAVLKLAGVSADSLRGPALRQRVVIGAEDGYEVVFSLAELDPSLPDRRYLLADRADGQPLRAEEAPLRLLIEGDPRHSRWIRQVTWIEVRAEP